MDRVTVAELLIDEAELAVASDIPVKTRGSGDHSAPVVLIHPPEVDRRAEGNSAKAGQYDGDGDGTNDGILLDYTYAGTATIETRSGDEVESYNLAKSVYDELAVAEEYPTSFHSEMNELSRGKLAPAGFQGPMPEPVYKHTFSVGVDYSDQVEVPFDVDTTGKPIENFTDNIVNDETLD